MSEQHERTYTPYTYTYDQFTVLFHGGRVYIGEKDYPVGQCCVDILNMDEVILDEIDRRVKEFVPAALDLLQKKTNSAAASAQEKLNAVWNSIFALPVYRDLNMDYDCNYHALENLFADKGKWAQVQKPNSEGHAIYQGMIAGLTTFTHCIRTLRQQFEIMTEKYLEPLDRRNAAAYADAYSCFYADMLTVAANVFGEDFSQSFPMEVDFVPMMHQTNEGEIFIAEKTTFDSLVNFLRTEFYRGLASGNAPRRCHNCGKYFLLTAGYNTCYCSNIAPGEANRTCRVVGAHRKESKERANASPARKEYQRTYNRLKQRKTRGKISVNEWNNAVAKAQELLAQAEQGMLSDEVLKKQLNEL